jgi:hypothetical protein
MSVDTRIVSADRHINRDRAINLAVAATFVATGAGLVASGAVRSAADYLRPIWAAVTVPQSIEGRMSLSNKKDLTSFLEKPIYGNIISYTVADGSTRYLASGADGTHLFKAPDGESIVNAIQNRQLNSQSFPHVFGDANTYITSAFQPDSNHLDTVYATTYDVNASADSNSAVPHDSNKLIRSTDGGQSWTDVQDNYIEDSDMQNTAAGISGSGEVGSFHQTQGGRDIVYFPYVNEDRQPNRINLAEAYPNNLSDVTYWIGGGFGDSSKRQLMQPVINIPPDEVGFSGIKSLRDPHLFYINGLNRPALMAISNKGVMLFMSDTTGIPSSWSNPELILPLTEDEAKTAQMSFMPDETGLKGVFLFSTGNANDGTLKLFSMASDIATY